MEISRADKHSCRWLSRLFHHRWAVPSLAALCEAGGGAKLVMLCSETGAARDSQRRALAALIETGLACRNPGHGHPMRPEYVLTPRGHQLAPACAALMKKIGSLGIKDTALKKWSLPTLIAVDATDGRFGQIIEALGEVTPRALTRALRDLQQTGLVERHLVDAYPPYTEYLLTGSGRGLTAVVNQLTDAEQSQ